MTNTASPALTAHNLVGVAWVENGNRAEFKAAQRSFGVRNAAGEWLSFDGVRPYCVSRKSAAVEVALTVIIDGSTRWVRAL